MLGARKFLVLSVVILCIVFACKGNGEKAVGEGSSPSSEAERSSILIAYVPMLDVLPYLVAEKYGLFKAEGLEVELAKYLAQMDVDTALVGGAVDGAFTDIIRVEQMKKKYDLDLDILTSTETQWALVSNKTARLNKLEQFGDKMVAMTRFSATDYLTDKTFKGVKTSALHFKVQINNVPLRLKMLQNNEMDAAWLPEPYATEAVMTGHKKLLTSQKYKEKLGVLVLREAFVEKKGNRTKADKLTKVYSMACDSINKYGLEAYANELKEYCDIDSAVINHLPKMTFTHAQKPTNDVVAAAKKYLEE